MKTALVTGGAKGIGLAISQELVALGWNVVVTGRDAQAIDTAVTGLASVPEKQSAELWMFEIALPLIR